MRARVMMMALALAASTAAVAKERAGFLSGQYATKAQCEKLRLVEAGGPSNVGTAPELLDADGFKSCVGGCAFTKVFEHDPGKSWVALMVCSEGNAITPEMYVFTKLEAEDGFEVGHAEDEEGPEIYTRCDARKGN
jgi:arylsulfatase A-like enzyme